MTDPSGPARPGYEALRDGIANGNRTDLARAISLVENERSGFEALLSALYPTVGRAHRVGVTGPPGAGKSTLVDGMIRAYREDGKSVAVVAVDPTSPFSGGALLGDRVRMESVATDEGVFIRSMATRGAIGGLTTTAREVCDLLDASGFDRIIVETVGIGQSELAIAGAADTAVLVLVPEAGDGVQVLKAGVMEIADLYVVNKADRPGADHLVREIGDMLAIRREESILAAAGRGLDWEPRVLAASALEGHGVVEVVAAVEEHVSALGEGPLGDRRRARLERHTRDIVDRAVRRWWTGRASATAFLDAGIARVLDGGTTPYELAREVVERVSGGENA